MESPIRATIISWYTGVDATVLAKGFLQHSASSGSGVATISISSSIGSVFIGIFDFLVISAYAEMSDPSDTSGDNDPKAVPDSNSEPTYDSELPASGSGEGEGGLRSQTQATNWLYP